MLLSMQRTQQPTINESGEGDRRPGQKSQDSGWQRSATGDGGRRRKCRQSASGGRQRGQLWQERWQRQKGWWASNGNGDGEEEGNGSKGGRVAGGKEGNGEGGESNFDGDEEDNEEEEGDGAESDGDGEEEGGKGDGDKGGGQQRELW